MPLHHIPVMLREAVFYLNCRPGKVFIDCTLGGSGHAAAILERIEPDGLLIGIDQDIDAVHNAERILEPRYASNFRLFHDNFTQLPEIVRHLGIPAVDGILLDLGLSLHQLESSGRGFSFQGNEPLDMRMNTASSLTAGQIVNQADAQRLADIFRRYGEERWARPIARRIVEARQQVTLSSTEQLARIVSDVIPKRAVAGQRIHPATRVFMALRIAVNRELECLDLLMQHIPALLNSGGRFCALAFHSLEDRIVKQHLKSFEKGCVCPPDFPVCTCGRQPLLRILTRRVHRPAPAEVSANPMARSTRLRAAERL